MLHDAANRIFAIAFSQRGLAFWLSDAARGEALAAGGVPATAIGEHWMMFDPWGALHVAPRSDLYHWAERAFNGS